MTAIIKMAGTKYILLFATVVPFINNLFELFKYV